MTNVEIDARARRKIEQILHHAQPRYPGFPGSGLSLEEVMAGGPPPGIFVGANNLLASKHGIDLTREGAGYYSVEDVCSRAPVHLLFHFLEASYAHLGRIRANAVRISPDEVENRLNRVFEEHGISVRVHSGKVEGLAPDAYAPTHLEEKFGILLSPKHTKDDFDTIANELGEEKLPIAVLFIDIDNFKALNTKYTETVVDKTILPSAQYLLRRLIQKRGMAYRHGGEEFVVIAPNVAGEEAAALAERIRASFESEHFEVEGSTEGMTVSVGVALWPDHGADFDEVLQSANTAKNEAKSRGRNRVCYAQDQASA